MANFTNNTTQLQNLLAKVNELPEAGSSGSSDIRETCTITRNNVRVCIGYTDENGIAKYLDNYSPTLTVKCLKNSAVFAFDGQWLTGTRVNCGTIIHEDIITGIAVILADIDIVLDVAG